MLNWDEFNEVENTEKTKQVPQEVVKEAVKQTAQETEEAILHYRELTLPVKGYSSLFPKKKFKDGKTD